MLQINLLPHREIRRAARRRDFYFMAAMSLVLALVLVFVVVFIIDFYISAQTARNDYIRSENAKLDEQIKQIADLKADIDSLRARQQAVEDLQSDRNLPVHLMDELVKQVPEGIYLNSIKQTNNSVALSGYAQSNDRISELLRNLSNNSLWLEQPDLLEIHAATIGPDKRRVFAFTMNVKLKKPTTPDPNAPPGSPANPTPAATPAVSTPATAAVSSQPAVVPAPKAVSPAAPVLAPAPASVTPPAPAPSGAHASPAKAS